MGNPEEEEYSLSNPTFTPSGPSERWSTPKSGTNAGSAGSLFLSTSPYAIPPVAANSPSASPPKDLFDSFPTWSLEKDIRELSLDSESYSGAPHNIWGNGLFAQPVEDNWPNQANHFFGIPTAPPTVALSPHEKKLNYNANPFIPDALSLKTEEFVDGRQGRSASYGAQHKPMPPLQVRSNSYSAPNQTYELKENIHVPAAKLIPSNIWKPQANYSSGTVSPEEQEGKESRSNGYEEHVSPVLPLPALLVAEIQDQLLRTRSSSETPIPTNDTLRRGSRSLENSPIKKKKATKSMTWQEKMRHQNRYKTELCKTYPNCHTCPYGHACQFAHSPSELRATLRPPNYKTQFCKKLLNDGKCPYGSRCLFIHPEPHQLATLDAKYVLNSLNASSTDANGQSLDQYDAQEEYDELREDEDHQLSHNPMPVN